MSEVKSILIRGAVVLGAVLMVGASAHANGTKAPTSIMVTYDDLNLANQSDAEELYSRLLVATQQVCAPYVAKQTNRMVAKRTCYRQALSRAVRDVRAEQLTEVHARTMRGTQSLEQLALSGGSKIRLSK